MNRLRPAQLFSSLFATLCLLAIFEIFSSVVLPIVGLESHRLAFHIVIVLFLGVRLQTPYLPLIILCVEVFHSAFSIEGWAIGTFCGVVITLIMGYLRDMLHLTTAIATMIIVQIFQVVWFVLQSTVYYFKSETFSHIIERFWHFIPESIVISLLSPFIFVILDKMWRAKERGLGVEA